MPSKALPPEVRQPGYTVVEPTDGRGARFVAFSLNAEQAQALAACARRLGIRPTDNSQFITASTSH